MQSVPSYYETENGSLYCADAKDVLRNLPTDSVDLIITDVPYGVEFAGNRIYNDSEEYVFGYAPVWLSEMSRVLKEGSHAYIFVPTLKIDRWLSLAREYFKVNNILAFQSHTTNRYIPNNFDFDLQLVLYLSKGKARKLRKVDWIPTSEEWLRDKRNTEKKLFTYKYPSFNPYFKANKKPNGHSKNEHGNQKSIELVQKLILLSSEPDEVVLDPFLGSGTVALASIHTGRKWVGVELNPEFCGIIKRRIESVQPRLF